jgi:hypothetical protein
LNLTHITKNISSSPLNLLRTKLTLVILLIQIRKTWNIQLVSSMFNEHIAFKIIL